MDGFHVMPLKEAAKAGDVFVTVTGDKNVITEECFARMKDGAIVANAGHFNVEIDIPALEGLSKKKRTIRDFVEEYTLKTGKKIFLLGEGRLINLAAAEGHPAVVMDMSFANQALSARYLTENGQKLEKTVYPVPADIDEEIARMKLATMGIHIDKLTREQKAYLSAWQEGT
jgi:adenosylhomocysteinase